MKDIKKFIYDVNNLYFNEKDKTYWLRLSKENPENEEYKEIAELEKKYHGQEKE